jgi:hypothetical protein
VDELCASVGRASHGANAAVAAIPIARRRLIIR